MENLKLNCFKNCTSQIMTIVVDVPAPFGWYNFQTKLILNFACSTRIILKWILLRLVLLYLTAKGKLVSLPHPVNNLRLKNRQQLI